MTTLAGRAWPAVLCAVALAGCDDGPPSFGDDLTDPQLPARGTTDLPQWLAAGYYQAWRCEPAPHPGRSPSPHGGARICNNDALQAAAATGIGAFPAGAASVKEVYDGGRRAGYAVSRKLTAGDGGDRWYWYERSSGNVYANGSGADNCTGCHGGAPRDYVFVIAP